MQDNVFGRARLHYGWWPSSGLYWSKGLLTLDMITDYDACLLYTSTWTLGTPEIN